MPHEWKTTCFVGALIKKKNCKIRHHHGLGSRKTMDFVVWGHDGGN